MSKDGGGEKREEVVAVAVDKDKSSQYALKWTVDHLLTRGQSITLLHVKNKPSFSSSYHPNHFGHFGSMNDAHKHQLEIQAKEFFLPFRCFCTRNDIKCNEVIIEDADIPKSIVNYVSANSIDTLVLGAPSRSGLVKRFKTTDVPSSVAKVAPEFCTVYVINKGKISSVRSASAPVPTQRSNSRSRTPQFHLPSRGVQNSPSRYNQYDEIGMRSPFTSRGRGSTTRSHELSLESDISFVSNARPSVDPLFPSLYDHLESPRFAGTPDLENSLKNHSYESTSSHSMEDVESEMKRLRMELRQTMEMYSAACKEALTAKKKATEQQKLLEEKKGGPLGLASIRYRKYAIEEIESATLDFSESRKIGEGGYGPVFRGELDHTPVAIKVLRPDAAQGRSQFQQEVEVLSCIRHPNMVLLLGACPEFGCLVYEYMANGSLEDRLFRRGGTAALPWQLRFRIAAEIGTALLFLHQTRPEPLVHRDLKPANILLDRNYVSKISDVGLARLVPAAVADSVTQYRMTATAGTFCYIDPEYQQTGMLGIKSDIYSLGVLLLQMITARPPMGLTHHMETAVHCGSLPEMLDPAEPNWPLQETVCFARLALKCAQMRRKDRPDLATVVVPELNRLRDMADSHFSTPASPSPSFSLPQEVITADHHLSTSSSTASSSTDKPCS